MSIILNEREFAERAIITCSLGDKPSETVSCVAKYYTSLGYKPNRVRALLEEFILRSDSSAIIRRWEDTISSAVKWAQKRPLLEIDSIDITEHDLAVCSSISSIRNQRVMFTLICLAKFMNASNPRNNNWVNKQDSEIFSLANSKVPFREQALMIRELNQMDLIRFSNKVDNTNINVTCLDYDSPVVIHITDFRNLGYQYMRYLGGSYFECERCGIVAPKKSNRSKYCAKCATEINRLHARESRREKSAS